MTAPALVLEERTSWGRVVRAPHHVLRPRFGTEVEAALRAARSQGLSALGYGLGRSYGDSNLNPDGALIDMAGLDRLIAFDPHTGVLRADAGVSLSAILRFSVPKGWFLPTTPGSRFVTLGGAIANDVHGKNHHTAGAFGAHVRRFGLVRSDRGVVEVDPAGEPELFAATIGGLGLTGLLVWAEIQLVRVPSAFVDVETTAFGHVDQFFELAAGAEARFEHTVSWIDCTAGGARLGRGLFAAGNWSAEGGGARHDDRTAAVLPIDAPEFALNPLTLRAFNALYYARGKSAPTRARQHYGAYFYPLDAIRGWNRLYGRKGFYQYQSVVPPAAARDATVEMLKAIAKSGQGSFLAVLKTFGPRPSPGLLSFPREGATLALDFANRGKALSRLFARLDAIVCEAGGRLYPAKDGRMPADMFRSGYGQLDRFAASVDPAFSSSFWRRVSA